MANINYKQIKEELLNRIRNADIMSITTRGVTTQTDNFTGTGSQTEFVLTNSGIKNIRSVKIATVLQDPLVDYVYTLTDIDSENQKINFIVAPGNTVAIEIIYDTSSTGDKIYDDFPKVEISNDKYPRIGFDIVSDSTSLQGFDRQLYQTELLLTFSAYGLGKNQTEDILSNLRQELHDIRKDLVRLEYIEPRGRSRMIPLEGTNDKVFKRSVDFAAPFEFEEG